MFAEALARLEEEVKIAHELEQSNERLNDENEELRRRLARLNAELESKNHVGWVTQLENAVQAEYPFCVWKRVNRWMAMSLTVCLEFKIEQTHHACRG
jgi:DNA repair exonuclease SbcCD ATPase subunit